MVSWRPVIVGLGCLLLLLAGDPASGQGEKKGFPDGPSGRNKKAEGPKKYDEVITKEAKSSPGVFMVHQLEDKLYFEIPQDGFGKLILWTLEVAKGPAGAGAFGYPRALGNCVVRFERRGNKVYLWKSAFAKRGGTNALSRAVEAGNSDTIIWSFSVEAEGKDRSVVIQATPLFTQDIPDFSVKRAVDGSAIDESRSYLEGVKVFPTNIEVRALLTFRQGGGAGAPTGLPVRGGGGSGSATALLHHSLVQLPATPMLGRYFDSRVGYFTESYEDYTSQRGWTESRQLITRFRLEKKDPDAAVSEPRQPIVFYLSREVPEKWRSYLKKGVEDWAPAFEKAGFKNAILCKEAPDERQDPAWDPEDARYSVIRWVASPVSNAMGPHVHDPRSGEIISAHVIFWHDITKLVQQWYFIQCGGNDPRVTRLPLPDEITGECLRYVACHEVGHTLGLRHNHRASQAYTVAQLRDPEFVARNGSVASIMSYGRFNYVAQPEDKVKSFLPKVAAYDIFAIEWGYTPITGAKTSEEERKTLDKWAARQLDEPFLRFGGEDGPSTVDPTVLTENIGNDALEVTALGLKNLERMLDKLVEGTTKLGEDYSLLEDTYANVLRHRAGWFGAVAKNVGGVVENRSLGRRGGEAFTPVPCDRQQKAVKFLLEHAFTTPRKLTNPAIVSRFRYSGVADAVMSQQKNLLLSLLSQDRFARLMDAEVLLGPKAYTALQLVTDVQEGIWMELKADKPVIDPLRRTLQRVYLEHLRNELKPKKDDAPTVAVPGAGRLRIPAERNRSTDFRAVARASLQVLQQQLASATGRTDDPLMRAHLEDCLREVRTMLEPARE
jgi:hypothetical protein